MLLKIIIFSPLFVVAIYSVHSVFKYTRMISNIFLSLIYRSPNEPYVSSIGQKITVLDSGDKEIEALFVERKDSKKMVLFCHESGAPKESWEKYASFLPGLGYHILSVGFGTTNHELDKNSLSQWPTEEEVQRVLTVIRWAKKALRPDLEIILFGVSNGADIAFAASFRDSSVRGVIADGLFSMKEIFRDYIRRWAPMLVKPNLFGENYPGFVVNTFANLGFWYSQKKSKKRFIDIERLLKMKHVPLLMIHGAEDDYIPRSHQSFLEKINRDQKILNRLVVREASHNQAVIFGRELYEKNIKDFLDPL